MVIETVFILILCFVFGSVIGSFLSVVAYRLPMGEYEPVRDNIPVVDTPISIASPKRSFCPHCRTQLVWYHTIPLLSWLALRGRCATCRTAIPFRYFCIELITALLCVCSYLRFGPTPTAFLVFALICIFIVIWVIDLDYMIIPDIFTYPGTALGVALGLASSLLPWPGVLPLDSPFVASVGESLIGILVGALPLYALYWFYLIVRKREGLGLGDIKLMAMVGSFFGYECAIASIFVGSLLGSTIGAVLILLRRHQFASYLSFGPYLIAGALLYIFQFVDLARFLAGASTTTLWRLFQ